MKFTDITIIYNPNSTGDSHDMAANLAEYLQKHLKQVPIKTVPTERVGHAWELARRKAASSKNPLIISSSGDGGYNEVINGVMEAGNPQAICAVLPAGNANDHSRTLQDAPLGKAIIEGKITQLDLIKVTAGESVRYAHSYVGLGLTPVVATELNKHTLNAFREAVLTIKTFFTYRPFKIEHDGEEKRLDSLLFANINQMAKLLTLSPVNRPDDGKFEIISFPSGRKWQLFKRLAKAVIDNLEPNERQATYIFTVIKKMPMQLDGEVMVLKAGTPVVVECIHRALKTII